MEKKWGYMAVLIGYILISTAYVYESETKEEARTSCLSKLAELQAAADKYKDKPNGSANKLPVLK